MIHKWDVNLLTDKFLWGQTGKRSENEPLLGFCSPVFAFCCKSRRHTPWKKSQTEYTCVVLQSLS